MLWISEQGFASYHSDNLDIDHIYTFVHFMDDPYFTPLNHLVPITILKEENNFYLFEKNYIHMDSYILTNQKVNVENGSVFWDCTVTEDTATEIYNFSFFQQHGFCAFGIAIKVDNIIPSLVDNTIANNLINYSQTWIPQWEGHSNIDIPIIKVYINGKPVAISVPLSNNVQCYFYKDGNSNYFKISSQTCDGTNLSVAITPIVDTDDLKQIYKNLYPESSKHIDFWKVVFAKFYKYYNLEVSYRQDVNRWTMAGKIPSQENVEKSAHVLWKEMLIYPHDFFKEIGLKHIILCDKLSMGDKPCFGAVINNTMFIDVSQYSDISLSLTLHHEIYHQMESKKVGPKLIGGYDFYNQKIIVFKKENEVAAEIFAYMLVDPPYIRDQSSKSMSLKHDSLCVLSFAQQFSGELKIPSDNISGDPIRGNYLDADRLKKIHKINNEIYKDSDKFVLTGLRGCGLSLINKFVGGSVKINEYPYDAVDNELLIYLVRDPVDYCAWCYHKNQETPGIAMSRWIKVYKSLYQQNLPFIRYEDIVTYNYSRISHFLMLTNSTEKVDWSSVDEQRVGLYDILSVPLLSRVWSSVRHDPIMTFLKYNSNF